METPQVTIGVPVYRVENYIERCARSLFEQTYPKIEYIFVDDCSPDQSITFLNEIIEQYPTRKNQVRIIRHDKNKGLAAVRNTVVENATGEFLIWVDSDDYIERDLVRLCVEKQLETGSDMIFFDFRELYPDREKKMAHQRLYDTQQRTIALLMRKTPVCVCGGIYKLSLYKENGIKAVERVDNNEDYQVSPRLSYYSQKVSYIDQPLYFYDRRNEKSFTYSFSKEKALQGWKALEILREFFQDKGEEYLHAIDVATICRYATVIKSSVLANDYAYFKELRGNLKNFHRWNYSDVPLRFRPCIFVSNYYILRCYLLMAYKLKDFVGY